MTCIIRLRKPEHIKTWIEFKSNFGLTGTKALFHLLQEFKRLKSENIKLKNQLEYQILKNR